MAQAERYLGRDPASGEFHAQFYRDTFSAKDLQTNNKHDSFTSYYCNWSYREIRAVVTIIVTDDPLQLIKADFFNLILIVFSV